jgi:hypothetical protein
MYKYCTRYTAAGFKTTPTANDSNAGINLLKRHAFFFTPPLRMMALLAAALGGSPGRVTAAEFDF